MAVFSALCLMQMVVRDGCIFSTQAALCLMQMVVRDGYIFSTQATLCLMQMVDSKNEFCHFYATLIEARSPVKMIELY